MRFQVEAPAMQSAIDAASLPVKRGHIPILECLHVVAKDNRLRIIGTNMDMEAQARCDASVPEAGSCSVDAVDLARSIKGCKGIVTAYLDGDNLRIEVPGANIALPTLPHEFPRLAKPEAEDEIAGIGVALKKLMPFSESGQHARQDLAGVCLDDGSAVATNGKRLARFDIQGGKGQIVPSAAFSAISKALGESGRFFAGERTWRVEAENAALAGKLIDMRFPPWRRAEIERGPVCHFDSDAMLDAISRATLGKARSVLVTVANGTMTLTGESWSDRQIDAKATLTCDGEDMQFVVYPGDMTDCIKVFAGSVVEVSVHERGYRFNTPERPDDYTMIGAVADARNRLPGQKRAA